MLPDRHKRCYLFLQLLYTLLAPPERAAFVVGKLGNALTFGMHASGKSVKRTFCYNPFAATPEKFPTLKRLLSFPQESKVLALSTCINTADKPPHKLHQWP